MYSFSSAKTLVISFIGMQSQEVSIKPTINIVLKPDTETLDEVVVIAYGTAKKESLTGSISVVDNKKIEKRITTSVTGALEGAAPGVQVNNTYGEPGKAPSIPLEIDRVFTLPQSGGVLLSVLRRRRGDPRR